MHHTTRRACTSLLLAAAGVTALAGCAGGDQPAAAPDPRPPVTAAPPPSTAPATITAPSITVKQATPTTKATATQPALPKLAPRFPEGPVTGVFVATGSAGLEDASFAPAAARIRALGYKGDYAASTGCSQGAEEALPQLDDFSVGLFFTSATEATRFATMYGPVIGTAQVTLVCLD
jgi:hypothetical protein